MKSSRPEEDVCCPSELGNGEEKSSCPVRELGGGVSIYLLLISILKVSFLFFVHELTASFIWVGIRLVLFLFLVLCSRSFSGDLYVNQHVDSKGLHQNISEIRIVETPLHSVRSVAQDGDRVFKLARHDFLLLRTAGEKWYKAEKLGPSSGQAGIHFYPVPGPGVEVIRFQAIILVDFSLAQALAILTDHELHYNLFGENCWKYAHARAEALLNSCIEIASDDNVRSGLKKEIENLMDARRRMPNEVVDIVQHWRILWGSLLFFTGICFLFWVTCGMDLDWRLSFGVNLDEVFCMLIVLLYVGIRNRIISTNNLTRLATTYRWPFHFLSFFGSYVGWAVFLCGAMFYVEAVDSEDTMSCTNYYRRQDDSMENQRKPWPYRALVRIGLYFHIRDVVETGDLISPESWDVVLNYTI